MIPEIMSPRLYGIDAIDGMRGEEYCARVLNRICGAVVDYFGEGGGLLVNYREFPNAIWTRILPHFGVTYDECQRDMMRAAARYDAKAPSFEFSSDSEAKQRDATELIRTLADRHLGDVHRRSKSYAAAPTRGNI